MKTRTQGPTTVPHRFFITQVLHQVRRFLGGGEMFQVLDTNILFTDTQVRDWMIRFLHRVEGPGKGVEWRRWLLISVQRPREGGGGILTFLFTDVQLFGLLRGTQVYHQVSEIRGRERVDIGDEQVSAQRGTDFCFTNASFPVQQPKQGTDFLFHRYAGKKILKEGGLYMQERVERRRCVVLTFCFTDPFQGRRTGQVLRDQLHVKITGSGWGILGGSWKEERRFKRTWGIHFFRILGGKGVF
ncbi:hypothetical protein EUX98_g2607 [Antrodiella citrinella]|uniref:Uncharacterized protein n=1 Tax=Antrodiella citrinella TaxID=2447956 RepID=A0A4S4N6U9_9APHY|nr:hypothetical protein EUX98_g2607 [Antrodiella citrinella]